MCVHICVVVCASRFVVAKSGVLWRGVVRDAVKGGTRRGNDVRRGDFVAGSRDVHGP